MEKRKLKSLSVKEKLKLLEEVDKGEKKKKEIAAQFCIPASTLSTILKNRGTLKQNVDNTNLIDPAKKRFTKCVFEDVDKCVLQWALSMLNRNVALTSDMIREKARHFALSLGHDKFRASTGWLEKFKARHRILQKKEKDNSQKLVLNDFPSSIFDASLKMGQSMAADPMGKVLMKTECPENVAAGDVDYLNNKCDVIVNDIETVKIELETSWENSELETKDSLRAFKCDDTQTALQTLREFLNSRKNVPENVYNALNVIEEYCGK